MLTTRELQEDCALAENEQSLLHRAAERLQLSMRAVHRVLRVARTIADLDEHDRIEQQHLAEALSYRQVTAQGP